MNLDDGYTLTVMTREGALSSGFAFALHHEAVLLAVCVPANGSPSVPVNFLSIADLREFIATCEPNEIHFRAAPGEFDLVRAALLDGERTLH